MKFTVAFLVILVCLLQFSDAQQHSRPNRRRRPHGRRRTTVAPVSSTGQGDGRSPVSSSQGRCEEIYLPMCRGLIPYKRTKLPNQFGHTTQRQVYRALEYLWPFMDLGCSRNFRVLACGYYLPKCPGRGGGTEGHKPCRETCKKARRCRQRMTQLQSTWPRVFKCAKLLPKSSKRCIVPVSERPRCGNHHVMCERNQHDMCQGLNFPKGSIPNMFLQCSRHDIHKELDEYRPLVDSGCSAHLAFLLCGIYQPFCNRPENPFALPCQEICDQVKSDCEAAYSRLYGGLWWPGKLQCHRYPRSTDRTRACVMPSDTEIPMPVEDNRE